MKQRADTGRSLSENKNSYRNISYQDASQENIPRTIPSWPPKWVLNEWRNKDGNVFFVWMILLISMVAVLFIADRLWGS